MPNVVPTQTRQNKPTDINRWIIVGTIITDKKPAIRVAFDPTVDYAQLVKVYGTSRDDGPQARYSPGDVVDTYTVVIIGRPDQGRICTGHAERANLTNRMTIRRMTRLTNAHSKKWANHGAAFGLYFAFYNFCRPHQTLTEATWTGERP